MTEHTPHSDTPELDALAQLIAQSSFGALPDDIGVIDEMNVDDDPSDQDILLRERIRQTEAGPPWWSTEIPVGDWHTDTETNIVFSKVGKVFPNFDGSIRFDFSKFSGRTLYALDGDNRVVDLTSADARLPSGAHRVNWVLYVAAEQPCQSLLRYTVGGWELEAAIRWQMKRPSAALSAGLTEITPDLIREALIGPPQLAISRVPAEEAADSSVQSLSLRLQLEARLTDLLHRCGMVSDCAIRILPRPTGFQSPPPLPANPSEDSEGLTGPGRAFGDDTIPDMPTELARHEKPRMDPSYYVTERSDRSLSRLMKQMFAANEQIELPPSLLDGLHRMVSDRPYLDHHLVHCFAVLYEALRVEHGMDSIAAEESVSLIIDAMGSNLRSSPEMLDMLEQSPLAFLDLLARVAEVALRSPSLDKLPPPLAPDVFPAEETARVSPVHARILALIDRGMSVDEVAHEIGTEPEMVLGLLREATERRRHGRYEYLGAP